MKQLDERVRASEGMDLMEQGLKIQRGDLIAPAHASTRVPRTMETPLTDAAFFMGEVCDTWEADNRPELKGRLVHDMVIADFARQLETDRARLLSHLQAWVGGCGDERYSSKDQVRDLIRDSGDLIAEMLKGA